MDGSEFRCPVNGCQKELRRLQVMHFRYKHGCDPVEWVNEQYGSELKDEYSAGKGCYVIAEEHEWLSSEMVKEIVNTRSHQESVTGENNPMKRERVAKQFTGEDNPAKRPAVREKISNASEGRTHSEEAREKISKKNTGNTINEEHRKAVSEASSKMDRSYMQTEEYSQALSRSLKGREPTYPKPYEVDEIPHMVRSSWEEETAKLLTQNGIEYDYEERFELSDRAYYPDFVTEEFVIEVKGFSNERSVTKAIDFMNEFSSYTYVIVGDEIPCDIHIPWEKKEKLIEVVADDG